MMPGPENAAQLNEQQTVDRQFDLSIVIVNMNSVEVLAPCLASIRQNRGSVRVQVILVDNGSRDESLAAAEREFPGIDVLPQARNLGYVPANNVGLRMALAPYTMFLNNDTLILPGCLEAIVEWLDKNPKAGAASGQILNSDGTDQGTARRFPSVANGLFGRRSLLTRWFPNNRWSRNYMLGRQTSTERPFEVEILSSACMVVRTELACELHGMDEDFQLYWVDAEMCSRIARRGFGVWCIPSAKIVHYEGQGGSTKTFRQRLRSTVAFHRDAYHAYTKVYKLSTWHPRALAAAVLLETRCAVLMTLQLLRPSRATSSGGKN